MGELETKVKLLEKEIHDRKGVFQRLDIAIEKLTDVSNSINRMLAVHEEKIAIELNGTILPKQQYRKRKIKNNDKIEIVQFIGGG